MKVFVTGGTGVIGRRVLPLLVEAGHSVTALARSADKAETVRVAGAQPVTLDLFDRAAVRSAVTGCDAVVNLATKIPPPSRALVPGAWTESHRLRSEGATVLAEAAGEAGVSRLLQESIAFIYPDRGDRWIDEDVPLDAPRLARGNVAAERAAAAFTAAGGAGVVLRFGQFYAPESVHTRFIQRMVQRRLPGLPGPRKAYAPAIAASDAASAVVAALHAPAGTWNVTDDRPLMRQELHEAVADVLGVRPPLLTGSTLLRLHPDARFYLRSLRVSNRRFAAATGWSPRHADAGEGWRAMVTDLLR